MNKVSEDFETPPFEFATVMILGIVPNHAKCSISYNITVLQYYRITYFDFDYLAKWHILQVNSNQVTDSVLSPISGILIYPDGPIL